MANGEGPFVWLHWFEGVVGGLILMIIGGVIKLIRLDQRVGVLEKKEATCAETHEEVVKLKVEMNHIKESQDKTEAIANKIFEGIDDLKREVRSNGSHTG